MIEKDKANDFVYESLEVHGQQVWIVGEVVKGSKKAVIRPDREILHMKGSFLD